VNVSSGAVWSLPERPYRLAALQGGVVIDAECAGVLFDLDQTLIDRSASIRAYARRLWAERSGDFGIGEVEFVDRFIELDGNGYVPRPTFFRRFLDAFPDAGLSSRELESHFFGHVWEAPVLVDGALEGLGRLRACGVPIGIVTNGGSINQRRKVERGGLVALVDGCFISEELGVRKPDRGIFETAAREIGIDPGRSWFVGDHPVFDICGSRALGFRTIWVRGELPWPEDRPEVYQLAVDDLKTAMNHLQAVLGL